MNVWMDSIEEMVLLPLVDRFFAQMEAHFAHSHAAGISEDLPLAQSDRVCISCGSATQPCCGH
jgi:hypothetical protein